MKDEDFDQLMNTWADDSSESAPNMLPSADMYRMVEAMQQKQIALWFQLRWVRVGAVAASFVLVLFLLWTVADPGPVGETDDAASTSEILEQLTFQYQAAGSMVVNGIDLRQAQSDTIRLSSGDKYRLLLEPTGKHYVYVFQLTSSGEIKTLHPKAAADGTPNPLEKGQEYYLPNEPKWLYFNENMGPESMYVFASTAPLPDLDLLLAGQEEPAKQISPEESMASLSAVAESINSGSIESAATWSFVFDHDTF